MSEVCGLRTCCFRYLLSPPPLHRHNPRLFAATTCSVSIPSNKKQKVIVISGPTGAGKSRFALELAKGLDGEIISADSVQVYRGLDVGSAKPTTSGRKEVPHHLIDILHPSGDYSVGQFFEDARQASQDILNRGCVPIVVGGTGLDLRWFVYGKPDVPKASKVIVLEVYFEFAELQKNEDWDAAVQLVVKRGDPNVQSLAANDWYWLRRSLEIIKASGSPPSAFEVQYETFKEQFKTSLSESSHVVETSDDVNDEVKSMDLDYDFICFFLSSPRHDLYRSIDMICIDQLITGVKICLEAVKGFCLRLIGFLIWVFFQIQTQ